VTLCAEEAMYSSSAKMSHLARLLLLLLQGEEGRDQAAVFFSSSYYLVQTLQLITGAHP